MFFVVEDLSGIFLWLYRRIFLGVVGLGFIYVVCILYFRFIFFMVGLIYRFDFIYGKCNEFGVFGV